MMVRYFDNRAAAHDAMGWVLTLEQIVLLATMGAEVQADEHLDERDSDSC